MRVNATNSTGTSEIRKSAARTGSGFSVETAETAKTTGARAAQPLAALDGLVGLQEEGDERQTRRRAVRRAADLLDMLERIRIDLLDGAVPPDRLEALLRLVRSSRGQVAETRLQHVLDEIELRARVELAKLGHAEPA